MKKQVLEIDPTLEAKLNGEVIDSSTNLLNVGALMKLTIRALPGSPHLGSVVRLLLDYPPVEDPEYPGDPGVDFDPSVGPDRYLELTDEGLIWRLDCKNAKAERLFVLLLQSVKENKDLAMYVFKMKKA